MSSRDRASLVFAPGLLDGQVALVTGGGTGLGKATALELARCGATVAIAGRRADVLEQAASEIGQIGGADRLPGDGREPDGGARRVRAVLEGPGGRGRLAHHAGGQAVTPPGAVAPHG